MAEVNIGKQNWTVEETVFFINILREKRILKLLENKKHRKLEVFRVLETPMKEAGFPKSGQQLQVKWKHLKESYFRGKKCSSYRSKFRFYDDMEDLLGMKPPVKCEFEGVDSTSFSGNEVLGHEDPLHCDDLALTLDQSVEVLLEEGLPEDLNLLPSTSRGKGVRDPLKDAPTHKAALKGFAKSWRDIQVELQEKFLQDQGRLQAEQDKAQAEFFAREMRLQRAWEEKVMERQIQAHRSDMAAMMQTFLQHVLQQPQPPAP